MDLLPLELEDTMWFEKSTMMTTTVSKFYSSSNTKLRLQIEPIPSQSRVSFDWVLGL